MPENLQRTSRSGVSCSALYPMISITVPNSAFAATRDFLFSTAGNFAGTSSFAGLIMSIALPDDGRSQVHQSIGSVQDTLSFIKSHEFGLDKLIEIVNLKSRRR